MPIREVVPFIRIGDLGIGSRVGREIIDGERVVIEEGIDDAGSNEYGTLATIEGSDGVRVDWYSGSSLWMGWVSVGPEINKDKYLKGRLRWTPTAPRRKT